MFPIVGVSFELKVGLPLLRVLNIVKNHLKKNSNFHPYDIMEAERNGGYNLIEKLKIV